MAGTYSHDDAQVGNFRFQGYVFKFYLSFRWLQMDSPYANYNYNSFGLPNKNTTSFGPPQIPKSRMKHSPDRNWMLLYLPLQVPNSLEGWMATADFPARFCLNAVPATVTSEPSFPLRASLIRWFLAARFGWIFWEGWNGNEATDYFWETKIG